jgi:hypothetical protein
MKQRRTLSEIDEDASPSLNLEAQSGKEQAIVDLSRRMLSWSLLWSGPAAGFASTEGDYLVRERLLSWLERCIGCQARGILMSRADEVSLTTSTPLLTAFLGRRAMRELSRRVLDDL